MSWVRCAVIAPKKLEAAVLTSLKDHKSKVITEKDGMCVIAYEGRFVVPQDPKRTLTLGVDGNNIMYVRQGHVDLAAAFNAKITLTVGFLVRLADKDQLTKDAKAKKLIKKIQNEYSQEEETEEEDRWGVRCDGPAGDELDIVMASLRQLASICASRGIEHKVGVFSGEVGDVLGELDDCGVTIGPMACAEVSWDVEVLRTETVELVLNDSQTLLDGNGVEEFATDD